MKTATGIEALLLAGCLALFAARRLVRLAPATRCRLRGLALGLLLFATVWLEWPALADLAWSTAPGPTTTSVAAPPLLAVPLLVAPAALVRWAESRP